MITNICFLQVLLSLTLGVLSTELLPERYLKPEVFNHHPFTDVGIPATLKKALKSNNPYAILSKKRPREGREFPPQNAVFYPTPHPSIISRKYVENNEINKYDDPYINVPKNYAFSYIVKDGHSGDDFSHSQAHNGKATRGQYRVKLPDGRTQIVSYTADHKGYRADVQYEDPISKPSSKTLFHPVQNIAPVPDQLPDYLQSGHDNYQTAYVPNHISAVSSKPSSEVVYTVTASPSNYDPSSIRASPVRFVTDGAALNLVVKTTTAPQYFQTHYVTTTAAPFVQQPFITSTAKPQNTHQQVSSTPLYPVEQATPNTVIQSQQYHSYEAISSTVSPEHAVIVTPRPAYNRAIRKNEQSAPLYYRLL